MCSKNAFFDYTMGGKKLVIELLVTNLGTIRNISWNCDLHMISGLGGDVWLKYLWHSDNVRVEVGFRASNSKSKDHKDYFVKFWAQSFKLFRSSCLGWIKS